MNIFGKKILCSLIAAATISGAASAIAAVPGDVAGTGFETPVQVLSALGIMVGDGDGNFRPNDNLTRAEVAKIAIHAMGIEDAAASAAGQSKFPDVSTDFWANGYINLATSMGIVIGDDQGNFRPQDSITYAEAMTIMVRATGFEPSATRRGGFPDGYIMVGSENGINKNVQGSTHSPITRGNVANMTLNAIKANMMEQTGFGDNPTYEITDKTLMSDKLRVTELTGQVTAIPTSSLDGSSSLADGQVKIGDVTYDTSYNMNKLLGYNVTYYVKDDRQHGEYIILGLPTSGKNSEVAFTADLFDKVTTKNSNVAISYYKSESDSKTQTAEIASDAKLIYNGRFTEMNTDLLNLADKSGEMKLLDTNRDGKYDIVFVTNYYHMLVNTVSTSGKITDKLTSKAITLDDKVTFTLTKGLETIKVTDLREYDVLSVAESLDGELFEVIASSQRVSGKIQSISEDRYTINGTEYKAAPTFSGELSVGMTATFYLDFEGKIIAINSKFVESGASYGYMSKAYSADGGDSVKFKIFTTNGEDKVITGAEKIKLNGANSATAASVLESLKTNGAVTPQLITYKLDNDGKLSEINTAIDNSADGAVNEGKFTLNYKLTNAEFNATTNKLNNVKVTNDTLVFDIPADGSEFDMADITIFEDKQKYDVQIFDVSEDFTAKVIVVTNSHLNTSADTSIAVVKEIATGTNADGEVTDILIAMNEGKEVKFYAESDNLFVKGNGNALEAGDIVQVKKNSKDEITSVRVLFDIDAKETEAENTPAENLKTVYGKVTKKFADSINVSVNGGSNVNYELPADVTVYSVDTTVTKNNVTISEVGEIQAYDEDENNRIFIKIYKDVVQEIVIIK